MKFITEMELRDLYKMEPFMTYVLEEDIRITPGARQFLTDRRVKLVQAQDIGGKEANEGEKPNSDEANRVRVRENWCALRLHAKMESIESLFLLIAELLNPGDADLSEEVMALSKCFRTVRKAEREQQALDNIQFSGCLEEIKKRSLDFERTIDSGVSHPGVRKGKEVALLKYLYASLREVEPAILEAYWNEEKQICSQQDLIDSVNSIIDVLYMLMGKCLGG